MYDPGYDTTIISFESSESKFHVNFSEKNSLTLGTLLTRIQYVTPCIHDIFM